nr:ATP-dependent DNA helicase SRS2-like protein At4g25120 [Ipomoea batatas]
MVCWNIWTLRNNIIWKNQPIESAGYIVKSAQNYYAAWCEATIDRQQAERRSNTIVSWTKPPQGFLKLNVDAAINKQDARMGFGCVLRDELGHFIAARGSPWRGYYSAKEAEAVAIRESLTWIKTLNVDKIIIETDSLQVTQALESNPRDSSFFVVLLGRTADFLVYGQGQQRRVVIEAVRLLDNENKGTNSEFCKLNEMPDVKSPNHFKDKSKKWLKFGFGEQDVTMPSRKLGFGGNSRGLSEQRPTM